MTLESNCNFNKVHLLSRLASLCWRIQQYKEDAEAANHPLCVKMLEELEADVKKHEKKLVDAVEGLAKEGKLKVC